MCFKNNSDEAKGLKEYVNVDAAGGAENKV